MRKKTIHVVPNSSRGGWDVKQGGAGRAFRYFDIKKDAIDYGRDLSRNVGSEFCIHGLDGKIQQKDSHGNDPFPPRG